MQLRDRPERIFHWSAATAIVGVACAGASLAIGFQSMGASTGATGAPGVNGSSGGVPWLMPLLWGYFAVFSMLRVMRRRPEKSAPDAARGPGWVTNWMIVGGVACGLCGLVMFALVITMTTIGMSSSGSRPPVSAESLYAASMLWGNASFCGSIASSLLFVRWQQMETPHLSKTQPCH